MPKVAAFHSVNETNKPIQNRVHHNNSDCPSGYDIPKKERIPGTGGYRLCKRCKDLGK